MSEHAANATQHASDVGRVVATVVGAPARATSRMRTAMHRHRRPKAVAAIEAPTRHQTAQDAHEAESHRGESPREDGPTGLGTGSAPITVEPLATDES